MGEFPQLSSRNGARAEARNPTALLHVGNYGSPPELGRVGSWSFMNESMAEPRTVSSTVRDSRYNLPVLDWIAIAVLAGVAAVWLRFAWLYRRIARLPNLRGVPDTLAAGAAWPKLSVVVACRNEASQRPRRAVVAASTGLPIAGDRRRRRPLGGRHRRHPARAGDRSPGAAGGARGRAAFRLARQDERHAPGRSGRHRRVDPVHRRRRVVHAGNAAPGRRLGAARRSGSRRRDSTLHRAGHLRARFRLAVRADPVDLPARRRAAPPAQPRAHRRRRVQPGAPRRLPGDRRPPAAAAGGGGRRQAGAGPAAQRRPPGLRRFRAGRSACGGSAASSPRCAAC